MEKLILVGHRGTRKGYDENTIGAFKKAIEYGADFVELDIHQTKDNKVVVIHDDSLDRTTNGSGLINDLSYKHILEFKTLSNGEKIPTLIETINILKEQVGFIIELKESKILNPTLKIVSNIKKFKFILSSRNIDILKDIRKKNKKIPICYNITKAQKFTLSDFIETKEKGDLPIDIDMINLRSNLISREFIKKCQRYNILSLAWDFLNSDTPINDQKKLIRLGINGLLFDDYKNIKTIKEGKESYN